MLKTDKIILNNDLNKNFNFWRGFFSLMILISHAWFVILGPEIKNAVLINNFFGNIARIASLFFFFTSGYFFIYSTKFKHEKSQKKPFSLILIRLKRIYPSMILLVLFLLIIDFLMSKYQMHGRKEGMLLEGDSYSAINYFKFSYTEIFNFLTFSKVSLAKSNPPVWFIILDFWLHILSIFLYNLFTSINIVQKLTSVIITIFVFYVLSNINNNYIFLLFFYALGCLFALTKNYLEKYKSTLLFFGAIVFLILQLKYGILFSKINIPDYKLIQIASIFIFICIFYYPPKIFFLTYLTKFSYELYLFHFPSLIVCYSLIHKVIHNNSNTLFTAFLFLLSIISSISISFISNKLINKIKSFINQMKFMLKI